MGRPGNPAPEPMSATVSASSKSLTTEDTEDTEGGTGNSMRAAKRDSPKWRGEGASGGRGAGGGVGGVPGPSRFEGVAIHCVVAGDGSGKCSPAFCSLCRD